MGADDVTGGTGET